MDQNCLNRRSFVKTVSGGAASLLAQSSFGQVESRKPNIIVIFCDDLGYGDLSIFGHPSIHTPNLDQMAYEGQKWTNFYAAASVCTPSRAGIMTGRLPIRSGMCSDKRRVLFPDSSGGLPADEITIAAALKPQGYATGCIGKWHLGHLPQYLPTSHGFDSYFGIPYSNDMDRKGGEQVKDESGRPTPENYNVPLMRNGEIVEQPANQYTITKRYTEEALRFIDANKEQPFFLYLAHNLPHIPLFTSDEFKGNSARGLYGDVIEEIDHGVGLILQSLKDKEIAENTLVVFTSDNGPWLPFKQDGGSAGLLKDGKGTTWEGGMREPTIFWQPGKIKPGVIHGIGSTLDILPTACKLAGAPLPDDRYLDGLDLSRALYEGKPSPRKTMLYYRGQRLYAVRKGAFKAHFITETEYTKDKNRQEHDPPLLFNLMHDPAENFNVADQHPEVLKEIAKIVEQHNATLAPVKDQLADRIQ